MGNMTIGMHKKHTKFVPTGINLGDKFGRLTVIADGYDLPLPNGLHKPQYLCECSCQNHTLLFVTTDKLKNGSVTSCGCIEKEQGQRISNAGEVYNFRLSPEAAYTNYQMIYDRCYNPKVIGYHNHYGANINLCPRWLDPVNGLRNFYEDMGPTYRGSYEVERYDRTKDYSPDNCFWKPHDEMKYDHRPSKNRFEYDGCNFTIAEWAKLLGCNQSLIYCRIHLKGWTNPEEILFGKLERKDKRYRATRNAIYYLDENNQPDFSIDVRV